MPLSYNPRLWLAVCFHNEMACVLIVIGIGQMRQSGHIGIHIHRSWTTLMILMNMSVHLHNWFLFPCVIHSSGRACVYATIDWHCGCMSESVLIVWSESRMSCVCVFWRILSQVIDLYKTRDSRVLAPFLISVINIWACVYQECWKPITFNINSSRVSAATELSA